MEHIRRNSRHSGPLPVRTGDVAGMEHIRRNSRHSSGPLPVRTGDGAGVVVSDDEELPAMLRRAADEVERMRLELGNERMDVKSGKNCLEASSQHFCTMVERLIAEHDVHVDDIAELRDLCRRFESIVATARERESTTSDLATAAATAFHEESGRGGMRGSRVHPTSGEQEADMVVGTPRQGSLTPIQRCQRWCSAPSALLRTSVLLWRGAVIHPDASAAFKWNVNVMFCVLYSAIVIPTRLSFGTEANWLTQSMDFYVEVSFLIDIAFNHRIGYVDSDTLEVVLDRKLIMHHYHRGWFALDCLSSIPVEFIALAWAGIGRFSLMKLLRTLKLFRLARLLNLKALQGLLDHARINASWIRLFKLVLSFFIIMHLSACAYWFMVRDHCEGAYHGGKNDMPNFCPPIGDIRNVGAADKLIPPEFALRYSEAFQFALMIMIGNTSYRQDNAPTIAFTNCMLLVGIAVFSAVIGASSSLLSNIDATKVAQQIQVDSINHYLAYRKVSPTLRTQVTDYVKYLWQSGQSRHHHNWFEELPPTLTRQLQVEIKRDLIDSVPWFRELAPDIVLDLIGRLEPTIALPGEFVVRKDDTADGMYFISRGRLSNLMPTTGAGFHEEEYTMLRKLEPGAHFGELALLGVRNRLSTVRADVFSELQRLKLRDFSELLSRHEQLRVVIEQRAKERLAADRFKATVTTRMFAHRLQEKAHAARQIVVGKRRSSKPSPASSTSRAVREVQREQAQRSPAVLWRESSVRQSGMQVISSSVERFAHDGTRHSPTSSCRGEQLAQHEPPPTSPSSTPATLTNTNVANSCDEEKTPAELSRRLSQRGLFIS